MKQPCLFDIVVKCNDQPFFVFTQENMASTSGGGGGGRLNIGASIEKLMELAHSTGELVLTCRNLKSFPKNRCKYDLKDTVLVGKKFQLL